jgi:hypothetical protein
MPVSIWVSSPDGLDHAVPESDFARSPDGRFVARCGVLVISTSMSAEPGRRCDRCSRLAGEQS